MPNDHALPTRRAMLAALPAIGLAPAAALAAPTTDAEHKRLLTVIEQLEAHQGWEAYNVAAAKAFAAWQMRKALGLALPDSEMAQAHVDMQRRSFEGYRKSYLFEMAQAEGKNPAIPAWERGGLA